VEGQDDFASMAEVVRRRYTRLLNESRVDSRESRAEGGEPIPGALQELVDEVSLAAKRRGRNLPNTDAAAADVRAGRAPGATPSTFGPRPSNLPDLILIDGGKGQLNMACAELKTLGLEHIPVIGLAKEFEEIYRPGQSQPLRLPPESGALKLLQRVRDESHRFANTYNAQLRLKRISESILDEFPNIGGKRKAALLKKFGSVQRIRLATVEQISEVPGFGGKAAEELKKFLEARFVTGEANQNAV
jgi:excinuclease ABC subunit C